MMKTHWLLLLGILIVPSLGASAAGKYSRTTVAGVEAPPGQSVAVVRPASSSGNELDMTAVEMLEDASADDLTTAQLGALAREVQRMDVMRAKLESDGSFSDRDAEKLYRSTVRSCQKVMTPTEVRAAVGAASVNRGRDGRTREH